MEENEWGRQNTYTLDPEPPLKRSRPFTDNIIWVVIITLLLDIFVGGIASELLSAVLRRLASWSSAMTFIISYYTCILGSIIALFLILFLVKKNRFILRSFRPARAAGKPFKKRVAEDLFVLPNNNTLKMLLIGILLGFITNFFCILCALLHGDIKLVFDFSTAQLPVIIFALVSVLFQSASEEFWCRGYTYSRLNIRYPVWAAIIVNAAAFGFLHIFNNGVSVLAIIGITITGISYSLVMWYTGSIWAPIGIHTMWNFTQNFLFGLPNSGLVSEVSVFHLDAANGTSNLIYDFGFGVEAALPALFADTLLGLIVLYLAKRDGRLGELRMNLRDRD